MDMDEGAISKDSPRRAALPFILMAAVVQGWVLYGIHLSSRDHRWPATDPAWFYGLLAVAVFAPLTVELLSEFARRRAFIGFLVAVAAAYFYFGWHFGAHIETAPIGQWSGMPSVFPVCLEFTVLWLLLLPFAQARLAAARREDGYGQLFSNAWRNKLVLAEAALFTGLFWLLLFLWQSLFHMLGINFFKELFEEPIFVYPVTSLAFGCAVHLVGSVDRFITLVLEQILNVLKWLATLAGLILSLFTIALAFNLPNLIFTGHKAIGVSWLLWLLAVMVLLLNAAYRDGSVAEPYPKWVARGLRWVVPFMAVVAVTALYALGVREREYGLTVERFWAFVVAGMALIYSLGYPLASLRKRVWLGGIATVNVRAALLLIVVIVASLTPVLSPYRLAAASQFELVKRKGVAALSSHNERYGWLDSPLTYLRFESGSYGRVRLEQLAKLQSGQDAEAIRLAANSALERKTRWEPALASDLPALLAKLKIYPAGRSMDRALVDALVAQNAKPSELYALQQFPESAVGIYVDLDGDQRDEFVLLMRYSGVVYAKRDERWIRVAIVINPVMVDGRERRWDNVVGELEKGNVSVITPTWNNLKIGSQSFHIQPN
jgi:Domain of unknown function (DUF4153)